jgi:hypothetical protein
VGNAHPTTIYGVYMALKALQVITLDGIEARIFPVQQGYRVEISTTLLDYWHPGIFPDLHELEEWLKFELEKLEASFALSNDWMMMEGDFDGNGLYRNWFICQDKGWQGYDPLTNRCYSAATRSALKAKIDSIEAEGCGKRDERISQSAYSG